MEILLINSFEFSDPETVATINTVNKHANTYIAKQLDKENLER